MLFFTSILSLAVAASAASCISQESAGKAACTRLTMSLGNTRVISNQLDLKYISSRQRYYNTRQSLYAPSCVVYPASAQDVSTAIQAIRKTRSRFAIKAGGHNPNDFFSSVDQGVLIDLSSLTAKSYDSETTLATYEPGSRFGEIYQYFQQFNRTVVGARLGGVGTGLALGGGLSFLSSQYGMACDGFRELEVVLPSGEIVTASENSNPDLFFALRGGGGNAYGVVTKYTVQSRPSGIFYAGNLIYTAQQNDAVIEALRDFTLYNEDPKAAVIGAYVNIGTPDMGVGADELIIMFLVYDGPDAGNAFANFTAIPATFNTMRQMPYTDATELPTNSSSGSNDAENIFRVGAYRAEDDSYKTALHAWRQWCRSNKGNFKTSSFDFQPIPRSLTDASKAQGGNAMDMPDGPWFWANYLITTATGLPTALYDPIQASFRDMVESIPNAPGLPLFINDANKDQNPLHTFSTFPRLKAIKEKYDPDGFFSRKTGGWSF